MDTSRVPFCCATTGTPNILEKTRTTIKYSHDIIQTLRMLLQLLGWSRLEHGNPTQRRPPGWHSMDTDSNLMRQKGTSEEDNSGWNSLFSPSKSSLFFFFFFLIKKIFCLFTATPTAQWKFPESNQSHSSWPTSQPQKHQTQAASVTYTTAWQHHILNPLSEARDQNCISSWLPVGFLTYWATAGIPCLSFFSLKNTVLRRTRKAHLS